MKHAWYFHPDGDTVCKKCNQVKDLEDAECTPVEGWEDAWNDWFIGGNK